MGSFSSTANIFAQASEPAGPTPGSLWSDTDANTLFRRNDANTSWVLQGQSGANSVGDMKIWCGTEANVPAGWLICDGTAISRTTRSDLFDMIGTEYGIGDGSTTFNIPDMQTGNQFPRGATNDAGRGNTGGANEITLTGAESGIAANLDLGEEQTEKSISGYWNHLLRKSYSKWMKEKGASRELRMRKLRHAFKDSQDAYDVADINALLEWEAKQFCSYNYKIPKR